MKTWILTLGLLVSGVSAAAESEWKHLGFEQDGVEVMLDYRIRFAGPGVSPGCLKCSFVDTAAPLFINVSGSRVRENSAVRVVLGNEMHWSAGQEVGAMESYVLDLRRQPEGHFTGDFSAARKLYLDSEMVATGAALPIHSSGYAGDFVYEQELAVVVDGHWLRPRRLQLWID